MKMQSASNALASASSTLRASPLRTNVSASMPSSVNLAAAFSARLPIPLLLSAGMVEAVAVTIRTLVPRAQERPATWFTAAIAPGEPS
jgi:acyl-CoA synthetase (AMP-forming)/AMP-acid ligase II